MESQQQVALFLWLASPNSPVLSKGAQSVERYVEGSAPANCQRVRLVYANAQTEAAIEDWVWTLNRSLFIAPLHRQVGLQGIELALMNPLTEDQKLALFALEGIEVFWVPACLPTLSVPGLLVMDMDSTAIQIECIDELAAMAGVGAAVAEVTERAMQGELDFEQSLRQRVAQLAGSDASIIDRLCATLPLMPGLVEVVAELKSHGWRLVVASGGFTPFVGHLKQLLDLDAAYANELVIENGKLVGTVVGQVVDAQYKADVVERCAAQWQIPVGQRLAIGDGANDIPMVKAADFGIAYHAKPKLAAAADAQISTLDLRVLPYLLQLA